LSVSSAQVSAVGAAAGRSIEDMALDVLDGQIRFDTPG
jgi:hypothetical protein